jgi:hypothetical protein
MTLPLSRVRPLRVASWDAVPRDQHLALLALGAERVAGAPQPCIFPAALAPVGTLPLAEYTGAVVLKHKEDWTEPGYGVVTFQPTEEPPFVFRIAYTDDTDELMTELEVQTYRLLTWDLVPAVHRARQLALGATLPLPSQPVPPPTGRRYAGASAR